MTKKIWTASEVIEKIQDEMDLQEETFIQEQEYLDMMNEAINVAEALIHNMNEDYFLTRTGISLVASTASYSLPSDIYANKIRHLQFKQNQTKMYQIREEKLSRVKFIDTNVSNQDFVYILENSIASGQQITFLPTPQANDSTSVTMWYIRNAKRVTVITDSIDIPEFIEYIFAFMKRKIAMKERSPLLPDYIDELDRASNLMTQTLDDMIPDEDKTIDPDLSFYHEFGHHSFDYGEVY